MNEGYVPPDVIYRPQQNYPSDRELDNLQKSLKSSSQFVGCPYPNCKNQGMTRVQQSCSICNICCCVLTAAIPWLIFQAIRKKDINCWDADHYCVRCGNKLASYRAC